MAEANWYEFTISDGGPGRIGALMLDEDVIYSTWGGGTVMTVIDVATETSTLGTQIDPSGGGLVQADNGKVFGLYDGAHVQVWAALDPNNVHLLAHSFGNPNSVCVAPDGETIVYGQQAFSIQIMHIAATSETVTILNPWYDYVIHNQVADPVNDQIIMMRTDGFATPPFSEFIYYDYHSIGTVTAAVSSPTILAGCPSCYVDGQVYVLDGDNSQCTVLTIATGDVRVFSTPFADGGYNSMIEGADGRLWALADQRVLVISPTIDQYEVLDIPSIPFRGWLAAGLSPLTGAIYYVENNAEQVLVLQTGRKGHCGQIHTGPIVMAGCP